MTPLPNHRPEKLSLGPLEKEILHWVWQLGSATVKDIHERILADPDRELAYTSVTTVLQRLEKKGWLTSRKQGRAFSWSPRMSQEEAKVLFAYEQFNRFLAVSNPDIVAAFADSLDSASLEQIQAIAHRLQAVRQAREEKES
ncbi:BlaI/MecI/CopY family transcriptional regulator [Spirulina subsalsa FACHB-351]|uniref:BlaI/MecI/CopY family transcriptional regulator n=1 Tax=Spirulina subsalsa FACHB-351 TaxID=234711 RepID=A0ABT3L7Z0_9CYAN|nr:BlaI/MecI/CopY family transcriptional regulator [Spirulina subsalsa]MCW6037604.1 BlaI/MecI/CopY family transcriptional regulator [Spirulina subsalsa FACHB-351]